MEEGSVVTREAGEKKDNVTIETGSVGPSFLVGECEEVKENRRSLACFGVEGSVGVER